MNLVDYRGEAVPFGDRMIVVPLNHPDGTRVSNHKEAITSPVVVPINEFGIFETLNTIYRRVP